VNSVSPYLWLLPGSAMAGSQTSNLVIANTSYTTKP